MPFLYLRNFMSFTALKHKFDLEEHLYTTWHIGVMLKTKFKKKTKKLKYLVVHQSVYGTLELWFPAKGLK